MVEGGAVGKGGCAGGGGAGGGGEAVGRGGVSCRMRRGGDGLRGGEEEEEGEGGRWRGLGMGGAFWEFGWEVMDGRLGEFWGGWSGLTVGGGEVKEGGV